MRRFFRLHPWRLEIIPAAAFALAVGSAMWYQLRVQPLLNAQVGLDDQVEIRFVWVMYARAALVGLFWLMLIGVNHLWVVCEQRKRTNWPSVLMQTSILIVALPSALLVSLLGRAHCLLQRNDWGFAIAILAGAGFALIAELKRPFVPRDEELEPPLEPPRHSSPADYREVEVNWWFLVPFAGMAFLALLGLRYGESPRMAAIAVLAVSPILAACRRVVTMTNEAIALSAGIIRKRILFAEIASCRVTRYEPFAKLPPGMTRWRRMEALIMSNRCLEITTKDGKVYLFGMVRPSYAAGLIESAINASKREQG